ncbi:DUF1127 domain-containing protein [Ruegeria lacuscaerulensis]|uniref:DUF1127 domain-containing protein n=1 Tax=Ruegeria lacuscaerulensis TaxID=55218 RepID=UPI00147C67B6|nr:DUF1127 domain-containing protein [Ruegeria lacuscaerulensis]
MTQIALTSRCKPHRRFSILTLLDALSLLRQRHKLARLDDRALKDIGITREQAEAEADRPIWDAPDFWQK